MNISDPIESTTVESTDDSPFTNEQQQRAWAVEAASDVLSASAQRGGSVVTASNYDRKPGHWGEIVEIAHYIVTGKTYGTAMESHNTDVVGDFVRNHLIPKLESIREHVRPPYMDGLPEDLLGFAIPLDGSEVQFPPGFPEFLKGPITMMSERFSAERKDALDDHLREGADDPGMIHSLLELVSGEFTAPLPSAEDIARWDVETRMAVIAWASAVHLAASDNDVEVPTCPQILVAEVPDFD